VSKYFDLLQEGERDEALQRRLPAIPQLPAGDDVLELDLPFLPDTRALATIPHVRFQPEPPRTLTFRSVVEGCFRYPLRFLAVAGLVSLLTVAAILWMPRLYQATMQLAALSPEAFASVDSNSGQAAAPAAAIDVDSQASLLRSRDLLSQAIDSMGAPAPAASEPSSSREKAIDDLARRINVSPVPASNMLRVSITASSPEKAAALLQSVASVFVSRELALLRPSHQRLVQLADQSQRKLVEAQQDLARFKQDTGIGSSADYEAAVMRQLDGYAADSANLAAKLAEVRQQRATPQQDALKARLAMLESKRNQLLDSYQVNDPVVLNVDEQITHLRDRLVRGEADPSSLEGKTQLAERNSVDAQKRGYVAQLNRLEAQSTEFERLQKQATEAQQAYDVAAARRDLATGDDARDRDRMLEAVVAARPSASSTPVRPRPRLYLAIGLPAALLLAVMVCAYAEMTRSTICSPAELDALTGVATLGTLAVQPAEGSRRSRRRKKSG
jgi:polysaccharide biosynthesis transport protein